MIRSLDSRPLDLEHAKSRAFQGKIIRAAATCQKALKRSRRPYIAFSGGKDALVLMGLLHQFIDPNIRLAWSDDELEYPEQINYMGDIRRMAGDQLHIHLGYTTHAGWFRPWEDYPLWREPFDGSIAIEMDQDEWMAGLGYDLTFLGLRMDENRRRLNWLMQVGPIYPSKTGTLRRCCPLWDWTSDDIWAAIALWKLPASPVYQTLSQIHVPRDKQRVGPLPLARRAALEDGWPDLLTRLESRYGGHWHG